MLKQISGSPRQIEWYPKTASTVIKNGSVVQTSSGQLIGATASSTKHVGVIQRDCLSTDSDYATAAKVPVEIALPTSIFEADVKSGVTATASQVGNTCDFYVSSNETFVDTGTDSHHQCTIVGFISATKVLVKINSLTQFVPAA